MVHAYISDNFMDTLGLIPSLSIVSESDELIVPWETLSLVTTSFLPL